MPAAFAAQSADSSVGRAAVVVAAVEPSSVPRLLQPLGSSPLPSSLWIIAKS